MGAFSTVTAFVSRHGFAMHLAHTRSLFFLVFVACAAIIGSVIYLQRVFGLSPCVLCLFQRFAFISSGLLALVASLHAPGRAGCRLYSAVIILISLAGATVAGGQVWLQTATGDQTLAAIALAEHLLKVFSSLNYADRLLSDASFCAEISWSLFGISLPEWSLLGLLGVSIAMLYTFFRVPGRAAGTESHAGD
jgi:disulfide bond formation protein DsbB